MAREKDESKEKSKRKRGAPVGNQNARTHGFYAKTLDLAEKEAFERATKVEGLGNEIALVRVKLESALRKDPGNTRLVLEATNTLARLLSAGEKLTATEKKGLKEKIAGVFTNVALPAGLTLAIDWLKNRQRQ